MNDPMSAREALLVEAIGNASDLMDSAERLIPALQEAGRAVGLANAGLHESLAGFEAQVLALTEKAKVQAVKHILARTDEAARRSIDQQGRAMADAARVAFGAELGATTQRLQSAVQHVIERQQSRSERWLTHLAAAAVGAAMTWALTVLLWAR